MITHLLDSISRQTSIKIVSCHHEQAAAFAAEGDARIRGIPGVALATSGPGATNLLTGIGSCFFDSTPTIFITGQVNTHELKQERKIRQLGFQETDIISVAQPLCKWAIQAQKAADLPLILERAFQIALEGRPGPCLIDIPMNVQAEEIDDTVAHYYLQRGRSRVVDGLTVQPFQAETGQVIGFLEKLRMAIAKANKPLLLMGGGCAAPANRQAARAIVESFGIPVVLSLMAVDLLPESHELRVGFIGSYGNRWANKTLGQADLLLVIGSRLDIRQTGSDLESFCEGKEIWQIDIDSAEIGQRVKTDSSLCCSIQAFANQLIGPEQLKSSPQPAWMQQINSQRSLYPAVREYTAEPEEINPILLLKQLSQLAPDPCQYVTDVGQHQMWAAQSLEFRSDDRFLTSGGMGAMGFGLPAAIGAAMARADLTTVLISGDGSFQLNLQELETIRRNELSIKILLFNNHCHGMVRQFQESYFHGNLQSTVSGYSAPDFTRVAKAYGIQAARLDSTKDTIQALSELLNSKGPSLLEVPLSVGSKVYPKLAFGRRFGEMEPEATPVAMEST
jgi:acetolactate synthase-1/2/3 large subunit